MGEIGSDLDDLDAEETAREEGRKPPAKKAEKPAAVKPPEKPEEKDLDEPAEKPPVKPDEPAETPEPKGLIETRNAYTSLKKKVKEDYEPKIASLEAKLKELETVNPPEVKALQERFEASEKRRKELEAEIKFADYKKSDEYIENHQKPYERAWAKAMRFLSELQVEEANGKVRPAEEADFVKIANAAHGEARRLANAMFGDSADDVMLQREKILDLIDAQDEAIAKAKKEAADRASTSQVEMKANREKRAKLWQESNSALVEKFPKMFGKIEGDTEGNAKHEEGTKIADRIFNQTPENAPKSLEEAVRLHARIYQMVANHDRLVLWLRKARKEKAELRAALDEYEKSEPNGGLNRRGGGGGRSSNGSGSPFDEANAELDELDKKG